jgi:outer membrane protein TolC
VNHLRLQLSVCLIILALSPVAYPQQARQRKAKPARKQPAVELPDSWGAANGQGISTQTAQLKEWWKNLGDARLDTLIDQALGANLDLKIADRRVLEARAARGVANAARYPEINQSDLVARRRSVIQTPGGLAAVESTVFQVGFDANWELDFFGGVRNSVRSARDGDIDCRSRPQLRRIARVSAATCCDARQHRHAA